MSNSKNRKEKSEKNGKSGQRRAKFADFQNLIPIIESVILFLINRVKWISALSEIIQQQIDLKSRIVFKILLYATASLLLLAAAIIFLIGLAWLALYQWSGDPLIATGGLAAGSLVMLAFTIYLTGRYISTLSGKR